MPTTSSQPPNIVFIMADDMGYGDVGCFNPASKIPTPHMDTLARQGIRFTDAHSPSAVCTPTRYGVMTGRYCWRTPLKHSVLFNYEHPLIEPDRPTVASLLQQQGYHTACIGKWHLGLGWTAKPGATIDFDRPLPWDEIQGNPGIMGRQIDFTKPITGGPNALGFDYAFYTSGCSTAQPPYCFIENDRTVGIPSEEVPTAEWRCRPGLMTPGWHHKDVDIEFASRAVAYIEEHSRQRRDQPFFLYFCPSAPHEPCIDPVVPEFVRRTSQAGPRGDLVALVDWCVGRVVDALDTNDLRDNTLVIVTSDNGALPGHSQRIDGREPWDTFGHASCGEWRGYKSHIWEGGHREPLIARWPGRIPTDASSDELVCLTDLMATCAAVTGADMASGAGEDSCNILPALLGEKRDAPIRDSLIHHSCHGAFSIRQGDCKLILDTQGSGGWVPPGDAPPEPGAPGQLYNMADDPAEESNLWERRPEIVERMTALLEECKGQ